MSKEGLFSITDECKHICCVQSNTFKHLLGVSYLEVGPLSGQSCLKGQSHFFFLSYTCSMQKFPSQGWNLHHSNDLSQSSDNARSLISRPLGNTHSDNLKGLFCSKRSWVALEQWLIPGLGRNCPRRAWDIVWNLKAGGCLYLVSHCTEVACAWLPTRVWALASRSLYCFWNLLTQRGPHWRSCNTRHPQLPTMEQNREDAVEKCSWEVLVLTKWSPQWLVTSWELALWWLWSLPNMAFEDTWEWRWEFGWL